MPSPDLPERSDGGLTLGTAGHIDHGKTALVAALTGTDTDRLAEEKRRGISIELGFAELDLADGRSLGIVDVPGHERLVRMMVAGAAGIDLFLLVVAADDGVMPQTREHLLALRALGIERGLVALNKIDAVDPEVRELAAIEVAELVEGAEMIEVSARTGEGIAELRSAIAGLASEIERDRHEVGGWPPVSGLIHIDRAFTVPGAGTVVTGTTTGGGFEVGTVARLLPAELRARIRGLQRHGRGLDRIGAGRRCAVNLAGIGLDQVGRGDVLVSDEATSGAHSSYRLDCRRIGDLEVTPLAGRRVQVHHGTRDVPARIVDLGDGFFQLRLSGPLVARAGDRVVLRRIAPPATLGGAEVVGPDPRRHGPGSETAQLHRLTSAEPGAILAGGLSELAEGLPVDPSLWVAEPPIAYALGRFSRERWLAAVAEATVDGGEARREGARMVAAPDEKATATSPDPPALGTDAVRVLALLARDGLEPRGPSALASELGLSPSATLELLHALVAHRRAVRVKDDVFYESQRLSQLTATVAELARQRGSISLAELRDALHTSRKYSRAILEHLDGEGILVRRGDVHLPRTKAPGAP